MERFGEKISAEACSGKEIVGLLKKMMMMMMMMKNMMTRKIVKSRMRGFSRSKLEVGRNELDFIQLDMSLKVLVSVFCRHS